MTRPGSVLLVSHYYAPHVGGIETVVDAEARVLHERGLDVEVLSSACGATPGQRVERGVKVRRIRAWNGLEARTGVPFPVPSPMLVVRAASAVRRADVVHVHDYLYLTSWVVAALCRLMRTPYVVTLHVGVVQHPSSIVSLVRSVVARTVGARLIRGAAACLPKDEYIREDLHDLLAHASKVETLTNGVDVDRYRPPVPGERRRLRAELGLHDDDTVVLFVGRLVPKKGFRTLLAARSPAYRLVFVGGDRPSDVAAKADDVFLGPRAPDEVARIYRAADLYVGASVGEGTLTAVEAMASGLPVVLNDDPGYRAIGASGPGVRFVAMAEVELRPVLEGLLADDDWLRAAGGQARRTASAALSWSSHADQLLEVYAEAVA